MWWGSRPRHCLKIGPDDLVWAELERGWTGRRHDRCVIRSLDPGLIRVSPTEPNLVQPGPIQEQVRSLVGAPRRLRMAGRAFAPVVPRPIVLLLPDVCLRTAVFELDRIPRRREERDALVRWRFGQDHLFPLAGAKVVYQMLSAFGPKEPTGRARVLAAAIHETVLEQYESLCMASGLVPLVMTTPIFQLCNLWLESQPCLSRAGSGADVLLISLLDRTFSVVAFRQGRPAFTRSKGLVSAQGEAASKRLTADQIAWTIRESAVSLRIWQEAASDGPMPWVVVAAEEAEPELVRELHESLQTPVHLLDWTLFRRLGWTKRMGQLPLNAMPAVAGLC